MHYVCGICQQPVKQSELRRVTEGTKGEHTAKQIWVCPTCHDRILKEADINAP